MPAASRRAVDALELETAARIRSERAASAAMKKFTVEPVPTPTTVPSETCEIAASAARCLFRSVSLDTLASRRNDCARFRGHSLFGFDSTSAEEYPALIDFKGLLLLRSFFLALLFRFSHVGSPVVGLVRGRSIYTRNEITSKHAHLGALD